MPFLDVFVEHPDQCAHKVFGDDNPADGGDFDLAKDVKIFKVILINDLWRRNLTKLNIEVVFIVIDNHVIGKDIIEVIRIGADDLQWDIFGTVSRPATIRFCQRGCNEKRP